jgi:hypothetical protein
VARSVNSHREGEIDEVKGTARFRTLSWRSFPDAPASTAPTAATWLQIVRVRRSAAAQEGSPNWQAYNYSKCFHKYTYRVQSGETKQAVTGDSPMLGKGEGRGTAAPIYLSPTLTGHPDRILRHFPLTAISAAAARP